MSDDRHDAAERFHQDVRDRIGRQASNAPLQAASRAWLNQADAAGYEYNFSWMGRPVIQFPQDLVAMQEIIWRTRPDLIVETGVAHGGSTVFYGSMLALLGGRGRVVGIDVDIRTHNRQAIEEHPMFTDGRIVLVEGSSVDADVVSRVTGLAAGADRVMVCLDSSHDHDHVLAELTAYSPLVRQGQYIVVFDTSIEVLDRDDYPDRPWRKGRNPMTAVSAFLESTSRFVPDRTMTDKLQITSAPGGFLRCAGD